MKIIIIDDDPVVVDALQMITEASGIEVVGTGNDGNKALELYEAYKPDAVLMDIRMSPVNGMEATGKIMEKYPDAKILLVTTFQDEEYIAGALSMGCMGYILKQNVKGIVPALNAVISGQMVFDSQIIDKIGKPDIKKKFPELSDREEDILELVAKGMNNKEISDTLFLSQGTVRNYISQMLDKLELRDRTQLAIHYYKK
ncbi:MAG: response regulator transcription factor [Clostridiaceae bacterium]